MKINLQKYIASCGVSSRRGAEKLITNKQITINDKLAKVTNRVKEGDVVKLNNKIIKPIEEKIYIMLNKPTGYTCTAKKFKGERNVFSLIDPLIIEKKRLFTVGRLDKNSSGLLILTNDGDLTLKLTHPKYKHEKEYEVTVDKEIDNKQIKKLLSGVLIETDEPKNQIFQCLVKAKKIKRIAENKISIIISEGKKRQIRLMLKNIGLKAVRLKRTRISGLLLNNLPKGKWRELSPIEIKRLLLAQP